MSENGDGEGPSGAGKVLSQWAIEAMEDALEKLKVLNYERQFCHQNRRAAFDRIFFAVPSHNPSIQFQSFLELISWLITEITADESTFKVKSIRALGQLHTDVQAACVCPQIDKFDDPNTSANKLVLALRSLNISLDFPVAKLKQPFGEAVCIVIDTLCEKLLQKQRISWQRPVYMPETDENVQEEEDKDVIADEVAEPEEEEEEAMFSDIVRGVSKDMELPKQLEADRKVLASRVDPVKWKTELERVGSRLAIPSTYHGAKQWREQLEQTKRNEGTIDKVFGDSKGTLQAISEDVRVALERIGMKEKFLNGQYESLTAEFRTHKTELKEVEAEYQKVNVKVAALSNDLNTITDRLEEIKESMNDRGQSMTDTSPLVKIRAAVQKIKGEISAHEIRIGIAEHRLLHSRISGDGRRRRKGREKDRDLDLDLDIGHLSI